MDKPTDASLYVLAACFMCIGLFLAHTYLNTPFAIHNSRALFANANMATESIFNPQQSKLTDSIYPKSNSLNKSSSILQSKVSKRNNLYLIQPFSLLKLEAPLYRSILSIVTFPHTTSTPTTGIKPEIIIPKPVTETKKSITRSPTSIDVIINSIPTYESIQSDPEKSVVNILCRIYEGKSIKNISSSGVLISNNGIILTNAHVAIHPFLEKYGHKNISCIAKNGSPATGTTPVEFIYISPKWTFLHKGEINGVLSQDSGEHDFAILKISPGNVPNIQKIPIRNPESLLNFAINNQNDLNKLSVGQSIRVFGYPIDTNQLSPLKLVDQVSITNLYSFAGNQSSHELIETTASKVGKSGASGGPIVDEYNYLIGIIANVIPVSGSYSASAGSNKIHGISIDYINNALKNETGLSLFDIISGDIAKVTQLSTIFENDSLNQVRSNLVEF